MSGRQRAASECKLRHSVPSSLASSALPIQGGWERERARALFVGSVKSRLAMWIGRSSMVLPVWGDTFLSSTPTNKAGASVGSDDAAVGRGTET